MQFTGHLVVSPLLLSLSPVIGLENSLIAITASLFIDVDHIYLVIKEKAFTVKKIKSLINNIHQKHIDGRPNRAYIDIVYLFHTVEFNFVLFLLSLYFPWLKYILIGFLFHIICDILHHRFNGLPVMNRLFLSNFIRYKIRPSSQ